MKIIQNQILAEDLKTIEPELFFEDMIKCVADIDKGLLAVNAELHADLEQLLLEQGSRQQSLYGFNILFDDWEIVEKWIQM